MGTDSLYSGRRQSQPNILPFWRGRTLPVSDLSDRREESSVGMRRNRLEMVQIYLTFSCPYSLMFGHLLRRCWVREEMRNLSDQALIYLQSLVTFSNKAPLTLSFFRLPSPWKREEIKERQQFISGWLYNYFPPKSHWRSILFSTPGRRRKGILFIWMKDR